MKRLSPRLTLCAVLALVACGEARAAQPPRGPLGLVPAGGVAVLRIDWAMVRADSSLREAVKINELEKIIERVGVGSGEVAEAVIFLDITQPSKAGAAMILRGRTRLQPVAGTLRERGWGARDFKGYRIFTEGGGDHSSLAGLRSGFLVVGTGASVERVIDAETGGAKTLVYDAGFRKLWARTASAGHPVWLTMSLPREYRDAGDVLVKAAALLLDFTGLGPLGTLLESVALARGVGFSLTRRGGSMPVSLVAMMNDDSAASLVSGTLTLMKGAASMLPPRNESPADRQARQVLESMSVTRTRETVVIRLTLPETELRRR